MEPENVASGVTILLVEDEPLAAISTVADLERRGYTVHHVPSTGAARDAVSTTSIDLVLLDLDLGRGGDSAALARELLHDHAVPIVFYSGHNDAEAVERIGDVGHFGYVTKDAGPHVLDQTVRMALRLSRAMAAQARSERRVRELLHEAHARIRSDMDLVRSMLSVQRFQTSDPQTQSALYEAEQHMTFLGRIYERIFRSERMSRVHLPDLVHDLLLDLEPGPLLSVGTTGPERPRPPRISPSVDSIVVDRTACVPIGIILWELTSNALRHAFPHGPHDEVQVRIHAIDDDWLEIEVSDNGHGLAGGGADNLPAGFGLSLVHTLAEQFNGTLRLDGGEGTRVRVTMQVPLAT